MLPSPPLERISLPAPAEPPARPPFPWAATLAPVIASLALWAFTQSVYSLLFALLGPLVAVGGIVDGARGRRRAVRRDAQRLAAALQRVEQRIEAAHERERQRLAALVVLPTTPRWHEGGAGAIPVHVGTGEGAPVVELTGDDADDVLAELRSRVAGVAGAPLLVDASGGIGVIAPSAAGRAVARAIAVQVAAQLPPPSATVRAPSGEGWIEMLPHAATTHEPAEYRWSRADAAPIVIAWAPTRDALPLGCAVTLELGSRPRSLTVEQAAGAAAELAERARAVGLRAAGADLPDRIELAEVIAQRRAGPGLSAAIGRGADGIVCVDLVEHGPHALIAGTTGSGKSELLVTWVLSMAHGRSPDQVSFVLVDFKGGAAFAPLARLPHVLATLSDLDPRLTRRAIESLRAELLRRERLLADHGARSIDDLPHAILSRLVIAVDEFAALVGAGPDLHDVFADLAARGRSLGMHLVLCTQRPSGVVRDAVLANIGLRVSLRVTDRADSIAMIGDDSAAALPVRPPGRAVLVGDGTTRELQVATAATSDAERIAGSPAPGSARPWCDPLPLDLRLDDLPLDDLPSAGAEQPDGGLPFGLVDLPAEQRQPVARHDPARHGHLLVLGSAGSGLTTLVGTLAESSRRARVPVTVVSADPADAWAQLQVIGDGSATGSVVIDDVDVLLARFDVDHRHEVVERLAALLRSSPGSGRPHLIVTARRLTAELAGLAGLFGSRLLLRQSSREEHQLAGGAPGHFDPDQPPGSGVWRGAVVQVARAPGATMPAPLVPEPVPVTFASHPVIALVAARPREHLDSLRSTGARIVQLGGSALDPDALHVSAAPVPTVVVGDPDAWHADWALLTTARREWPIVLTGCAPADHRALTRDRALPPPLGSRPGECWLAWEGTTVRALLRLGAARATPSSDAHDSVEERPENR